MNNTTSNQNPETVRTEIENGLFRLATTSDGFRVCFYPNCHKGPDRDYTINARVPKLIETCINSGFSVSESIEFIYGTLISESAPHDPETCKYCGSPEFSPVFSTRTGLNPGYCLRCRLTRGVNIDPEEPRDDIARIDLIEGAPRKVEFRGRIWDYVKITFKSGRTERRYFCVTCDCITDPRGNCLMCGSPSPTSLDLT